MAWFDISSFFNNKSSQTNSFAQLDFANLASIRNGSYQKLLKSYYSEQKTETSDSATEKNPVKKALAEATDTSGFSKLKKEADGLKTASEALSSEELWQKNGGSYDKDKILDAVKKFASEYNDVLSQSSKVSAKDVNQQLDFMKGMTSTMKGALSKVGVKLGDDGKLSVDEEAFSKAEMKDVKALFSGRSSYANQVATHASAVASAAVRNLSMNSADGSMSGLFNTII